MTKLIWLSDLHFSADGMVQGADPRERLFAATEYINHNYSDAEGCVISGDLVNRGTRKDYVALSEALALLRLPVFPLVGNHDNRTLLRSHLPVPNNAHDKFVQYDAQIGNVRILCLDTQKEGFDGGEFCAERAAWLRSKSLNSPKQPVLVFAHHPPLELGLPMQDQDCLRDSAALLSALNEIPQLRYMLFGHVHRSTCGSLDGIPFATMRSLQYQAPPPRPDWTWDMFRPALESPQIGVIEVLRHQTVVQFHDIPVRTDEHQL